MPATGAEHWTILYPELALVIGAVVLLMLDVIKPGRRGVHLAVVTFATLVASAYLAAQQWNMTAVSGLGTMVVRDNFGVAARMIVLAAAALATFTAPGYLKPRQLDKSEFYALLLLSTVGMTLLVFASDLVMVFLAVVLLSLALYVMAGFERSRPEAQEASL